MPGVFFSCNAKLFREACMRKVIVRIFPVLLCLLLSMNIASYAQPAGRAGKDGQKKAGKSKIVIEYISFPEALKGYDIYPWETLTVEEFKKSYMDMLALKGHDTWIQTLTGTGNKNRMLRVAGEYLLLVAICKPHFNPAMKKCYAVQTANGKFTYLGAPDENIKDLLKILLVDEYKDIYKGQ